MPMTTIDAATTPLPGYLAIPGGGGPWPGVLVIHEAWGLDDEMRSAADRLARMGFLALAPDLYRGHPLRCIRTVVMAHSTGHGATFDDLDAARRWLVTRPDCTGQVGVIGFCLGGGFALLLGATGHYAAASDNYGRLPRNPAVLRDSCPVVASYGARDRGLSGAATKLDAALTEYDVPHDVKEYPAAGHSFLNSQPNAPLVIRPLLTALGAGPEPAAAADAWRRIETFFHEHLGEPSGQKRSV